MDLKVRIEGIEDSFTRKIHLIENIQELDLMTWLAEFEDIALTNKWTPMQSMLVMKQLILDRNIDKEKIVENFAFTKEYLLSLKYPPSQNRAVLEELTSIKQGRFTKISEYFNKIKQTLGIYAINNKLTKGEYAGRLDDAFYNGLCPSTYEEIVKHEFRDSNECLSFLTNLDNKIISRMKVMDNRKSLPKQKNQDQTTKPQISEGVWCRYHKNNEHDSKDCAKYTNYMRERARAIENKHDDYKRNEFNNKNSNLLMKETKDKLKTVQIMGKIEGINTEIMIDSGASRNFIDAAIVRTLGIEFEEDKEITITFGNNVSESTNRSKVLR